MHFIAVVKVFYSSKENHTAMWSSVKFYILFEDIPCTQKSAGGSC